MFIEQHQFILMVVVEPITLEHWVNHMTRTGMCLFLKMYDRMTSLFWLCSCFVVLILKGFGFQHRRDDYHP